jgi:hypothetical protein
VAKLDPKTLVKLLTRTCVGALESAVMLAVNRRHREVTSGHFLRAMLDDASSDVPLMLASHGLESAPSLRALEDFLGALPGDHTGKPVFAPDLLQLIEDAWEGLSKPRRETRVRSGVLLVQLTRDAGQHGGGRLSSLLQALARTIDARSLVRLARSRESAEVHLQAVDIPAPHLPQAAPRRVDYRRETEISARSLVARVVDFVRYCPSQASREEKAIRDNPPRLHRRKQLEAILAAFDIAPKGGALAPEIALALGPETGIDQPRRLDPIELFIDGHFVLARRPSELAEIARRLRPHWPKSWPPHSERSAGEPVLSGADLQVVWERALRFRQEAERLVDFNGGVRVASGWHLCAVELTESVGQSVYASLQELDSLLAEIVDPRRRVFSRDELIRSHGFPDVDLFEIDCEWD